MDKAEGNLAHQHQQGKVKRGNKHLSLFGVGKRTHLFKTILLDFVKEPGTVLFRRHSLAMARSNELTAVSCL